MQGHVKRFSDTKTIFVWVLVASYIGYGAFNDDTMNCEQKLMEEIFVCVYQHNISLTSFLLAVGGINNTDNGTQLGENKNRQVNVSDASGFNGINNGDLDTGIGGLNLSEAILLSSRQMITMSRLNDTKGEDVTDEDDVLNEEFKLHVCKYQQKVMECTFKSAKSLLNHPACAMPKGDSPTSDLLFNDQRYRVKSLMEAILGQYDVYCAHQCRTNLLDDMRTCYDQFGLDDSLFMSRESHGAVIGSSAFDVDNFCRNREPLVECLRAEKENCPESDLVLSAIGLDLDMMERGFQVLCKHQYTYLRSLECFESHTPEVGICHSVKHRRMIDIASLARLQNWTSQEYLFEICRIRLDHIECDLEAWSNKKDELCDENILHLKRKLHCSLIPKQCLDLRREKTDAICNSHSSKSNGAESAFHGVSLYPLILCAVFVIIHRTALGYSIIFIYCF